jgi:hypothetical protein
MVVSENRLPLFGITLAGENASAETISPARRCGQETTLDLAFDVIGQSAAVIADIARNLSIGLTLARLDHGVEKAPQQPAAVAGDFVGGSEATRGNRGRGVSHGSSPFKVWQSKAFPLSLFVVALQYTLISQRQKWLNSMRSMRMTHALHRTNVAIAWIWFQMRRGSPIASPLWRQQCRSAAFPAQNVKGKLSVWRRHCDRRFEMPEGVDADKIEASFKKGVLTLTLPKKLEAQKPAKKIEVKAA